MNRKRFAQESGALRTLAWLKPPRSPVTHEAPAKYIDDDNDIVCHHVSIRHPVSARTSLAAFIF
jgi:hypothetical protein